MSHSHVKSTTGHPYSTHHQAQRRHAPQPPPLSNNQQTDRVGGVRQIDPVGAVHSSDDLHAWSLFRQNLNANFSDSALNLNAVGMRSNEHSKELTTSNSSSPPPFSNHHSHPHNQNHHKSQRAEAVYESAPNGQPRPSNPSNFQLRESTVNNILSHPKYGAQLKNQDAFTYLRFGLPRVKATVTTSRPAQPESPILDHQPPNRPSNYQAKPKIHHPNPNSQLNEELKRRFWNSDTNIREHKSSDFESSGGNSDSSGREMLPPTASSNRFIQNPNHKVPNRYHHNEQPSSPLPTRNAPHQQPLKPSNPSTKFKQSHSVSDLRYKSNGHLDHHHPQFDEFDDEYSPSPSPNSRLPPLQHHHRVATPPYDHHQQQQQHHQQLQHREQQMMMDEDIRLEEMMSNGGGGGGAPIGPSSLPPPLAKHPHLVVKDLLYEVDKSPAWRRMCGFSRQKLRILEDISFDVRGGELMAILATSATEGTALLNVLANRHDHRNGTVRAELYLNGVTVTPRNLSRVCAYVQQEMCFCPDMSARQALLFAGLLMGPAVRGTVGSLDIKRRTRTILEELNLGEVRHARIYELTDSEKRRLHIAIHLLLDTEILILDQPLQGLDIFDAFFLVEYLRQWAAIGGRSVIMTMSPPTYEVFTMLNRVLLLSAGRTLYVGPRRDFLKYFTSLDFPCPPFKNPSDYYLDLVTMDDLSQEALLESSQRVENLAEIHIRRPLVDLFSSMPGPPAVTPPPFRRANLAMQFLALWIRALIFTFPYNVVQLFNRFLFVVTLSLLIGGIFWQVRTGREQEYVWDRIGFVNTMLGIGVVPILLAEISNAHHEKQYILSEVRQGFYSLPAYLFAKMLYSAPQSILLGLAYALPACSMAGLQHHTGPNSLPYYLVVMLTYYFTLRTFALGLVWTFRKRSTAVWGFAFLFTLFFLGSGTLVNLRDLAFTHRWLRQVSPIRWVHESLIGWEFEPNSQIIPSTDGTSSTLVSPFLCSRNPVIQQPNAILVRADCGFQTRSNILKWFEYQGGNALSSPELRPWWHVFRALLFLYLGSFLVGSAFFCLQAYYYCFDKMKVFVS